MKRNLKIRILGTIVANNVSNIGKKGFLESKKQ